MEDDEEVGILPPTLPLSKGSFTSEGIYLHTAGDYLLLIVMENADRDSLIDLFDTEDWQKMEEEGVPQL